MCFVFNMSFLQLPYELQKLVLDPYLDIPPRSERQAGLIRGDHDVHDHADDLVDTCYDPITTTRRSLLLTSKAVHRRWSPFFWSSVTIVIGQSDVQDLPTFQHGFLAHLDVHKLHAIRHLVYLPVRRRSPSLGQPPKTTFYECDNAGVLELGKILQIYSTLLNHLQTVQLHFQPIFLFVPPPFILNELEGQAEDDSWKAMDREQAWASLTDIVTGGDRASAWAVTRHVSYKEVKFGKFEKYKWATSWTLTCQKGRATPV